MKYNFESIELTNKNNKLVRKIKENKKLKNRIKRVVKKVINK